MPDDKLDLFKTFKDDYAAPKKPALVDVGPAHYLAIEGWGAPGGEQFTAKIGGLYSMAYTIKMSRKFGGAAGLRDYTICKLEAQWWTGRDERKGDLSTQPPEQWRWRLMIRTPDFIKQADLNQAVANLEKKGKDPEFKNVRLWDHTEGRCVQMLHVGPYEQEGETYTRMAAFANERGLTPHGPGHDIYLNDPRRIPPERLKTILRLPVD